MLELRGINTFHGKIHVLHDLSLRIDEGEIITLIGANGAGKSTTLMSVCGITPPRSGEIFFKGQPIQRLPPDKIVSLGISQVPEGRRIFSALSVAENLELGAYLRHDKAQIRQDMEHCYALFPILAQRRSQPGGNLSGGEQQMLAICRALMARPQLLLLDEPSMGLAPLITKQIFDIIRKINKEDGTAIFLVEQNASLALKTADRGYVLENGRIILHDTAANLLSNKAVQTAYLGI
ncbi:MAG: ABC transporter ATP-binding protein [Candidatus Electronema sp. V4]|uniref:ABC transporter ATP-binding protein n=1 Tax=Candidatus Electronema sp. V4 TaxID=3454756 RepID=UPI0040557C2E